MGRKRRERAPRKPRVRRARGAGRRTTRQGQHSKRKAVPLVTDEIVLATAELIQRYDWHLFLTLTTREHVGIEVLSKRYRELVRRVEEEDAGLGLGNRPLWRPHERLVHVLAWELQDRDVWHLHALWAAPGAPGIRREWVRKVWNRLCRPRTALVTERASGIDWIVTRGSELRGCRRYELAGVAKVELVDSQEAVAGYCSKYVAKGGAIELFGLSRQG